MTVPPTAFESHGGALPSGADSPRILLAGVGNVFLGDDGFGVEAITRLAGGTLAPGEVRHLEEGVSVADYGIRGVHLAYDLLDDLYDTVIFLDAIPMDEPPGTVALITIEEDDLPPMPSPDQGVGAGTADSHGLHPLAVLCLVRQLGGTLPQVRVVGCQPAETEEGLGLSKPVQAAVEGAVAMALDVAHDTLADHVGAE